MQLSPVPETSPFARHQLVEVLMNVPFPLTVLHGPNHQIVLSNRAELARTVDRVPVGKDFAVAFPELAPRVLPILDRVFRDGVAEHEKEVPVGDRHVSSSYIPLRAADGSIEGVIVSSLDVTAEVELRDSSENQKRWLEFVIDLIPIPTILVQPGSGEVLLVNAAGKKQMDRFASDPDPFNQKDYYFTDLSGSRLALQDWPRFRAARGEELYGLQLFWNYPGGKVPLVVESRRLPQAYGHPAVVAIHYHDVSDLKQVEVALRESVADLQRERDLRERFVATLTHDLRNPLTAAKLSAEIIARDPGSAKVGALANRICGSVARADRMVRDLLDANRLKSGESFPLRLANHCLNDVARTCLDGLRILYGDRFVLEAPSEIRGRWCRSSLNRIFENLCGNAIKYGSRDAPVVVSLAEAGEWVTIEVENEGPPISREDQLGLFQPYRRARIADSGTERGWGLGLTLVRGLAEAHGGSVTLDYSDARGTRFRVRLPRVVNK